MKILLIAKPWKGGLGRYFFLALQDMFPGQVEWMSTRPQGLIERLIFRRDPEGWWRGFLKKIETTPCDAAFFVGYRKEFQALKPQKHYTLYIVDDVRMAAGDAAAFGRVFLSDPGYENELRAAISPQQYGGVLPFAYYPPLHKPAAARVPWGDVCFIGNRDAKRDPYLEQLFTDGLNPLIVDNYFMNSPLFWQHPLSFRPTVSNDAMGDIYAGHKVSLNVHARVVRQGTNMRTFECAGYGIPQVVEYREGIENYFEPEREILACRDPHEMAAQIRALLNDPARAQNMAAAAMRRARAEHTYHHRIAAALGHLLPEQALRETLQKTLTRKAA